MKKEQLNEAVFDHLPFPAFTYDAASALMAVNRAARDLLRTPEDPGGRSCAEVLHCQGCGQGCGALAGLKDRKITEEHTIRFATNAGQEYLAYVTASQLIDDAGCVQGALALFTRVVEQHSRACATIVAESPAMCAVVDFARRVAASEAVAVLLEGESGTGKEVVARLLHDASRRSTQPFVAINCAAMPETLLESELFGYEKGAFTDARTQKKGLFELAHEGTLFLDEIGELPLKLQAKLLRVLDDQTFRRLGGLQDIHVDFRIVAATNRGLRLAVAQGIFRLDLFYRLNIIQLTIPPLRERPGDIVPLARFFIDQFSRKFQRSVPVLSGETAELLLACDWPGNVRELRNVVERALLLEESICPSPNSPSSHLRDNEVCAGQAISDPLDPSDSISLKESEKALIAIAMAKTGGNQVRAAKLLGISRDALRYRLKHCPVSSAAFPWQAATSHH